MDRQAWIVVTLCAVALVLWYSYTVSHPPAQPATATAPSPAATLAPSAAPVDSATTSESPSAPASTPPLESIAAYPEKIEVLRNADAELRLTNRGGAIKEVVLLNHVAENGERVTLNQRGPAPIAALVEKPGAAPLPEFTAARQTDGSIIYERTTPQQIRIRKRFFFAPSQEKKDEFVYGLDVEYSNAGTQPFQQPNYFITLGEAKPIHSRDISTYTHLAWCIDGKAKYIDVNWFNESNGFLGMNKRAARPIYQEQVASAEWGGVANQFFATLVVPLTAKADKMWGKKLEVKQADGAEVPAAEGALGLPGFQLAPGKSVTQRYQIYSGPKLYHRLAQLTHNEAEIMDFGLLKIVSQALLNLMNLLHSWLGNYAAAILALTTIVKLSLWPLQNKANRSMRRMAALSPKMQELRTKYKDDPTRMNQELMKLYKQYGVNPVGGCLPMMIQIPIFWGLFTMLRQAVELRNAGFLWVHDLSQPDTIAHLPILGWPINILPLLMGATSLWMTHITPKTGDSTQQRIMMFTPIIFVVFCYNFAAALALYYTTQNLFTILQLYQNRKMPMPTLEKVTPPGKQARRGKR